MLKYTTNTPYGKPSYGIILLSKTISKAQFNVGFSLHFGPNDQIKMSSATVWILHDKSSHLGLEGRLFQTTHQRMW